MGKKYTANEIRQMAGYIEYERAVSYYYEVLKIAEMLRQAADMMDSISKEIERIDSMPGAQLTRLFAHQEINGKILIKFFDLVKKIIRNEKKEV